MNPKFYFFIFFLFLFWFYCLYWGFKNKKKVITPVDYFLYNRALPNWTFVLVFTGVIFSGWIFFIQPSLVFLNGLSFAMTSLFVIAIPLIGILFSKRQWMFSKKFGFVTPGEMIGSYFKSDILRVLVVVVTLGFAIPIIAVQLYLGGLLISILIFNQ